MTDRYKRLGLKTELEGKIAECERRLKGIAGSINDAAFAVGSPLDTDGEAVAQFGKEYLGCWKEGQKYRKRLEELENE